MRIATDPAIQLNISDTAFTSTAVLCLEPKSVEYGTGMVRILGPRTNGYQQKNPNAEQYR